MKKLLVAVAALAAATGLAMAAEFAEVDADASGTVSMDEAMAAMPELTEDAFAAADADGSGDLSPEEFAALAG
ncbi:calmodulin [Oricola thermophila]|uniref:Calmodulin n=1 Tax=Oricola thermophila TaxID=2742145 RepID=A0A6N1V8D8_9HYPH|nr:calmodulin [Oricola thermophila]QKV17226.1 calmodulin [Oricola thermophila]